MGVGIKVTRKSYNLDKFLKKINKLAEQSVSSGYFPESGRHSEYGMHYATLMKMHEFGFEGEFGRIPSRPVKAITHTLMQNKWGDWSKYIKLYLQGKIETKQLLDNIGNYSVDVAYSVFGNNYYLQEESYQTQRQKGGSRPLVESGEFRDNWRYKTSINKIVIKV